ncbi:metal-dependent hydrolase [Oleiphilus messinensis]|nr:metal-dependent hydrolase [Oleiphilus messinensis]
MANFNTHLTGAAVTSGLLSSSLMPTGLFTPVEAAILWFTGMLGGIMPDIDSDSSTVVSGVFTGLGVCSAFFVSVWMNHLDLLSLWAVMLATFIIIRYALMQAFMRLTRHRGAFHSILAAITFGTGITCFAYLALQLDTNFSWGLGLMMFAGYMTHLLLDEIYAVDFAGMEFKQSFGSAIKPVSLKSYGASTLFLLISIVSLYLTPIPDNIELAFNEIPAITKLNHWWNNMMVAGNNWLTQVRP